MLLLAYAAKGTDADCSGKITNDIRMQTFLHSDVSNEYKLKKTVIAETLNGSCESKLQRKCPSCFELANTSLLIPIRNKKERGEETHETEIPNENIELHKCL